MKPDRYISDDAHAPAWGGRDGQHPSAGSPVQGQDDPAIAEAIAEGLMVLPPEGGLPPMLRRATRAPAPPSPVELAEQQEPAFAPEPVFAPQRDAPAFAQELVAQPETAPPVREMPVREDYAPQAMDQQPAARAAPHLAAVRSRATPLPIQSVAEPVYSQPRHVAPAAGSNPPPSARAAHSAGETGRARVLQAAEAPPAPARPAPRPPSLRVIQQMLEEAGDGSAEPHFDRAAPAAPAEAASERADGGRSDRLRDGSDAGAARQPVSAPDAVAAREPQRASADALAMAFAQAYAQAYGQRAMEEDRPARSEPRADHRNAGGSPAYTGSMPQEMSQAMAHPPPSYAPAPPPAAWPAPLPQQHPAWAVAPQPYAPPAQYPGYYPAPQGYAPPQPYGYAPPPYGHAPAPHGYAPHPYACPPPQAPAQYAPAQPQMAQGGNPAPMHANAAMLESLLQYLPRPGSAWSEADRAKWLQAVSQMFDIVYGETRRAG